ncbi:MAG: ABC transporter ATP-binding protein [Hyphomicrobiaceae bacterium]
MKTDREPDAGPELVLDGLTKMFGPFKAVDGVSLSVNRGEFITILGASGSGKTTTLMMIAGFDYPSDGHVHFRGRNITYMPPHLRNMGMVFQSYALFPHLTVSKNVAFPLKMRGAPWREIAGRVEAALDLVRLREHAHKLPMQLSGGQQQRVALARALVFGPSLLLMDEPLGALDKSLREQMQLEIKRIQAATGVTIISVTHDQDEALAMSDRIVVMEKGRVEVVATPAEIYQRPANRMVAEFMKETNILRGRVVEVDGAGVRVAVCENFDIVAASTPGRGSPADAVTLCLRPERIRVTGTADRAGARPARIRDTVYVGDIIKYHIILDGPQPAVDLVVKTLATSSAGAMGPGKSVFVSWDPADVQIIPE